MNDMSILEMTEMVLDYLQTICLNHEDDCKNCPLVRHNGQCVMRQRPDDWNIGAIVQNMKDTGAGV